MRELAAEVEVVVPFHDVDAMSIVWHGHYLKYLELARCELLRRLDYDYPSMHESGFLWPVVDCRLKYVRPARYAQRLRVKATLCEWENRLAIDYLILDAATGEKLTTARSIQVAVDMATGELQFVSPTILIEKLERAWSE